MGAAVAVIHAAGMLLALLASAGTAARPLSTPSPPSFHPSSNLPAAQAPPPPRSEPTPASDPAPARDDGRRPGELPKLAPRESIAGIRTLETTSHLVFTERPDAVHDLVTTFTFPDRARFNLSYGAKESPRRSLRFRYGSSVFALDGPGGPDDKATRARELTGPERLEVLRDGELRRAAFLFPDGVAWKTEGALRTADLGELGRLRARSPEAGGPPSEIEILSAEGKPLLALRKLIWVQERSRSWPATFEGWNADHLAWRETVETRDTARNYVDSFFLPPELRDTSTEIDRMLGLVRAQPLPAFAAKRVELAEGLDWEAARAEIGRLRKECGETLRPLGLALDPTETIELGPKLQPKAVLLRLATTPATLPEGFVTTPERTSRAMYLRDLAAATVERMRELEAALPEGGRPATPYVRVPATGPILLILPFAAGK